jgi:hypothetical protein
MAKFSAAQWRGPVPNIKAGGMKRPFKGLVLHIQQGTEVGTDATFKNPSAKVSAHFGNPKSGKLDQWVDTDDVAWAEVAGNSTWISIENEGNSGDSLTDSQLANVALLFAWLNLTESVPLQLADSPDDSGLGYHGMGGAAWGGHTNCPGQPIVDQRAAIITAAQQLVAPPTVTSIAPASGPAGTSIVITGTGFTFATTVGMGNASVAQMSIDSDTQITITALDGSGTADIVVTTPAGSSAAGSATFTYAAASPGPVNSASSANPPQVTGIAPATGATDGGVQVVITGSGFSGATSVGFGDTGVTQMNIDSDTQITATAPSGSGTVDVVVTTPAGASATSTSDQFTYA